MSYRDEAEMVGRIPLVFVELEMDSCNLRYGEGACSAALGVTGERKCYNTFATCQVQGAYERVAQVYRFCEENAAVPVVVPAIPLLQQNGVSYAPQSITPGKGLGVRASVTIRFKDAPWPDADIDPYVADRTHDTNQGSFWGKFRARNRYYEGRVLRIRSGFVREGQPFSWANFQDRVYVMESFKGPMKGDTAEIVAKDILKLADDKRALCPRPSKGQLAAGLSAEAAAATLKPAGIGDLEYPASGRLNIAGEIVDFTRSGDSLTLTRGVGGTVAKAHNADDTVQLVKRFVTDEIQNVIYELLTEFANIPTAYIYKPAWDAERAAFLAGVWSTDITEPTGVNTLISELTEQGTCNVWWDEVNQRIQFRALRPPSGGLPVLSDRDHFLADSLMASDATDQRVSQVLVYFDRADPTRKLDEPANFRQRFFLADPQASGPLEYGSDRIRTLYSRWFNSTSLGRVEALADALLERFRNPPRVLEFELDVSAVLATGDQFNASTRFLQNDIGEQEPVTLQVIEAQEKVTGSRYRFKAQESISAPPAPGIIYISFGGMNINLYTEYVNQNGVPPGPVEPVFMIMPGVVVSSASTLLPALVNPADWPAGSVIRLINDGIVAGHGGKGGKGASYAWQVGGGVVHIAGEAGASGGPALDATGYPLEVDNTNGVIGGGGGGGGGGGAIRRSIGGGWAAPGSGGGGGRTLGQGGLEGTVTGTGHPSSPPASWDGTGESASLSEPGSGGPAAWIGGYGTSVQGGVGGAGGDLGQAGQSGGAGIGPGGGQPAAPGAGGVAGPAVVGNSNITWVNTGDIRGSVT